VLSNPFASVLARDSENPSPILLRKWACDASPWNFRGKKPGCAWPAKRGNVLKKHPQARLRVSFIKQIWHSRSESTRIFYLSIRVHPSHPWLKTFSREEAQSSYAACNSGGTWK
jgi:hypothetical protein